MIPVIINQKCVLKPLCLQSTAYMFGGIYMQNLLYASFSLRHFSHLSYSGVKPCLYFQTL